MSGEDHDQIAIPEAIATWAATEDADRSVYLDTLFGVEGEDGYLSDDDLTGLEADVIAEIHLLNGDRTPQNLARMAGLDEYLQVISTETGRRAETQAARGDIADGIMARAREAATAAGLDPTLVGGDDEGGEGAGEEGAPLDPTAPAPAPEPGGDDGAGGEGAPAGEPVGAGAAAGLSTGKVQLPPAPKPTGSGLAARLQSRYDGKARQVTQGSVGTLDGGDPNELAASLALLTLDAPAPAGFVALNAARTRWFSDQDLEIGAPISFDQMAHVIWAKKNELRSGRGGDFKNDWLPVARARFDYATSLQQQGGDSALAHNLGVFTALDQAIHTIVASGGSCAPAMPRYEVNQYAQVQSPVEDNLPVVGAPRGTVEWVRALDFTDLRSGIGVTTDEEDANPEGYGSGSGETPFKPCVHVECPTPERRTVVAVSSCIEFGNLTYETWPEFVAARLKDLAANFASVKEVFYLDRIDEDSTLSQDSAVYGAYRSLMRHVDKEAWNYRKRHNMNVDARLDWYAPDWLVPALRQDLIEDFSNGTLTAISQQEISQRFGALGLNVVWYYDSASGEGQAFSDAIPEQEGDDDNANQFPSDAVWYLEAPGTHVRFDAGELNMGIVRDSILNKTNNMQLFEEQFIEVGMFGSQTVKGVTKDICVNGGAPTGMTVHTC